MRSGSESPFQVWFDGRTAGKTRRGARIAQLLLTGLSLGSLSYVGAGGALVTYGALAQAHGRYDAIIVAGYPPREDGQPGETLARRVERAVELFRAGQAPRLVMTGGSRMVRRLPAAEVAARYAVRLGVPEAGIEVESWSRTTEENAIESAKLLKPGARVLVVTSVYHVFRTRRLFRRYFPHADAVGAYMLASDFWGTLHEVFEVARHTLAGRNATRRSERS